MRSSRFVTLAALLAVMAALAIPATAGAQIAETKVSVAGPTSPYLPNAVNEPALAIDANNPQVLAGGANDLVDSAPCNGSSCDLTPDIGISGIYFSFDSGGPYFSGARIIYLTSQNILLHLAAKSRRSP